MGGIRCSYKNCSSKTDGVTHFFHYPVFDKVRCHKWLVNAQRMDFLNLKVRQLRSRVVCQHHFTGDCFMNSNRDQLKPGTVPTLNGPFCEGFYEDSNDPEATMLPDSMYVLESELIDNDLKTVSEKKAESSVKYMDFLTNSYEFEVPIIEPKIRREANVSTNLLYHRGAMERVNNTRLYTQPKTKQAAIRKPKNVPLIKHKAKEGSIHIISQEKISEPEKIISPILKAKKSLQFIDVSQPLKPSSKLRHVEQDPLNVSENNIQILSLPESNSIIIQNNENISNENISNQIVINNIENASKQIKSPNKKDLIAEKRKFNMKLRDIVAQSIDSIDRKTSNQGLNEKKTSEHLSSDSNLPNIHQYTIAALEKKIDLMQSLLLNRIDSNTQEIRELKKICSKTEDMHTDEKVDQKLTNKEMSSKKHLYNEISKFLPAELNSKIYEELFINQVLNKPQVKRRRDI